MRVRMGIYRAKKLQGKWKWKEYANSRSEFSLSQVPAVFAVAALTIGPDHLRRQKVWRIIWKFMDSLGPLSQAHLALVAVRASLRLEAAFLDLWVLQDVAVAPRIGAIEAHENVTTKE